MAVIQVEMYADHLRCDADLILSLISYWD